MKYFSDKHSSCLSVNSLTLFLPVLFVLLLSACSTDGTPTDLSDESIGAESGSESISDPLSDSQSGSQSDPNDPQSDPNDPIPMDYPVMNGMLTLSAGTDREATTGMDTTLTGQVWFGESPLEEATVEWKLLSGPGILYFSNPDHQVTQVQGSVPGRYVVEFNARFDEHESSDTLILTLLAASNNEAPIVSAGDNQTIELGTEITLNGTVTDDGLPTGSVSVQWEAASDSDAVMFTTGSEQSTQVQFVSAGSYLLNLTASDGELSATASVRITVNAPQTTSGGDPFGEWSEVHTSNGSQAIRRHEAGGVAYKNRLYLLGGRGKRVLQIYDPVNNNWENLGNPPAGEMHHFQPVVYKDRIYVMGALTCCFPSENVVKKIQILNPANNKWSTGDSLPKGRERGSAGVVVYKNKIYMVGGSTNGHDGGAVKWFDEYDPATGKWRKLADAPTRRDHFSAAIIGDKLIAAGGRITDHPDTFKGLVSSVDVYDFKTGKWSKGKSIPTKRAGAMVVTVGGEVVLMGGETEAAGPAKKTVEAYDVSTNSWRTLKSMIMPRHSGGAAVVGNAIHVVSGSNKRGGGGEITHHEAMQLN